MKVLVLNGSPHRKGATAAMVVLLGVVLAALLVLGGCAQGQSAQPASSAAQSSASGSTGSGATSAEQGGGGASASHNSGTTLEVRPISVTIGETTLQATLADTEAAAALAERLQAGPVTLNLHAYGGFEKVGPLPWALPTADSQTTTEPGDIMLYQGDQITIFMGSNTWAYTPLGHIDGIAPNDLIAVLGDGDTDVTLSV